MKKKMVLIHWDDAVHECSGEEGELVPSPLVTIGFLDKKTKKYVRLYHEFEDTPKSDYKRHTSAIPLRMVSKIEYLELRKETKKTTDKEK